MNTQTLNLPAPTVREKLAEFLQYDSRMAYMILRLGFESGLTETSSLARLQRDAAAMSADVRELMGIDDECRDESAMDRQRLFCGKWVRMLPEAVEVSRAKGYAWQDSEYRPEAFIAKGIPGSQSYSDGMMFRYAEGWLELAAGFPPEDMV